MKKDYLDKVVISFTNLYTVLDELSKEENSFVACRALEFKKYMEMSCMYLTDKGKLLLAIKEDLERG